LFFTVPPYEKIPAFVQVIVNLLFGISLAKRRSRGFVMLTKLQPSKTTNAELANPIPLLRFYIYRPQWDQIMARMLVRVNAPNHYCSLIVFILFRAISTAL
jgi:hypothetical protein